jgi:hypothetical protein
MQKGGKVIGSGTFNVIRTIDDIAASSKYYVDTFDILTGKMGTTVYMTRHKLIDTFANKLIIREVGQLLRNDYMKTTNLLTVSNDDKTSSINCFSRLLYSHWNTKKKQSHTLSFVNNVVQHFPEWTMLWVIFTQGIISQHHPLEDFTIFYTDPTAPHIVTLCIRTDDLVLPVYRRFDGDITSPRFSEKACLGHLFELIESVLLTLTYYTMYGLYHHFDIKPKNLLFSINRSSITIRLGDYDGLAYLLPDIPLSSMTIYMSDGYSSPVVINNKDDFLSSFTILRDISSYIKDNDKFNAEYIWESWQPIMNHHVSGDKSKGPTKCSLLDLVLTKNDLYGLGATIMSFNISHKNTKTIKKIKEVYKFGMDLMYGCLFNINEFDLEGTESPFVNNKIHKNNLHAIATISDAAIRLSVLRKMFSDKELVDVAVNM